MDNNEMKILGSDDKIVLAVNNDNYSVRRKVRVNIMDAQTGAAIEEVDVLTSADSILFDDNTTLPEKLEYIIRYSDTNPSTATIGGIQKGTEYTDTPMQEIINQLLHPYVKPVIVLNATRNDQYYEYGVSIAPVQFTANVIKESNPITSVELWRDTSSYGNFQIGADGGIASLIYNQPIISTTTFTTKVKDDTDAIYSSAAINYIFNRPIYYGVASTGEVTEAMIKGLGDKFIRFPTPNNIDFTGSFSPSNKCFMFAYQSYIGDSEVVKILDANKMNITNSFERGKLNILDATNTMVSYTWLRSNVTTQTNFELQFMIRL